jgi:DNA helicase HerA-like ATPase
VFLREELRPTHLAIMGLSGVGKSYLIENLIRQDIQQGTGFVLFDVHGDLADSVVAYLASRASKHRELADKIVLIEPFDPFASIGFNPLEQASGSSAYAQAQELASVLRVRWETKSFGPRSEELMRHALYTLSVNNLTLLELPALLTQANFREKLLEQVSDRTVLEYWHDRYGSLSEGMRVVIREPLLTRVSAFLADPQIREIVGQRQTTFSFSRAIREGQ